MRKPPMGRAPYMIDLTTDHDHLRTNVVLTSWLSPPIDNETFNFKFNVQSRKADDEVNYLFDF